VASAEEVVPFSVAVDSEEHLGSVAAEEPFNVLITPVAGAEIAITITVVAVVAEEVVALAGKTMTSHRGIVTRLSTFAQNGK